MFLLLFISSLGHSDPLPDSDQIVPEQGKIKAELKLQKPVDRAIVQMAQVRQSVDCLRVFLEDQVYVLETKSKWQQPDITIYENNGCLSQLPQKVVRITEE